MIHPIDLETGAYRRRLIAAVILTVLLSPPIGIIVGLVGMELFDMHDVSATFMVMVFPIEAAPRSMVVAVAAYYGERFSQCGWLYATSSALLMFGWHFHQAFNEPGSAFLVLLLFGLVLAPILIAYWSMSSVTKAAKGNLHVCI